jgi:hypothetical protein
MTISDCKGCEWLRIRITKGGNRREECGLCKNEAALARQTYRLANITKRKDKVYSVK